MRDVGRLTQVSERDLTQQSLLLGLWETGRHVGFDKSGRHAIDSQLSAEQTTSPRATHPRNPHFSRSRVCLDGIGQRTDHGGNVDAETETLFRRGVDGGTTDGEMRH